ncbi:MAG: polyprenyl synthetase family protein [Oscillospiraceae bacterium]|nr:polyprenyl synthetase family protein [Oscillospiraceae bacterium]
MNYEQRLNSYRNFTEAALGIVTRDEPGLVGEAMRYSLLGGGKRVRACLALAACEAVGSNPADAVYAACAVEMLHCYSLIHDDLPCMDNDDFRRGKPSCHKAFDEATALLAGDSLLTKAFEQLGEIETVEAARRCVTILAKAAGGKGMIYGQELDIAGAANSDDVRAALDQINALKTGCLIEAAVLMGAACGGCNNEEQLQALSVYAKCIGAVFQIVDDVLDETSSLEELGKLTGSDMNNNKVTYASLLGVDEAMKVAEQLTEQACNVLQPYAKKADFLTQFAKQLLNRKN